MRRGRVSLVFGDAEPSAGRQEIPSGESPVSDAAGTQSKKNYANERFLLILKHP
jgi:hypothetical protein